MLDFMTIGTRRKSNGPIEIYPKFLIKKSTDLMIRGSDFYAIWVESIGLWSTDEQDAVQLIDSELKQFYEEYKTKHDSDTSIRVLYMWDAESGMIDIWHKYCQKQNRDSFQMLDENLMFSNTPATKKDYASKRLSYPLENGKHSAWDKLISTLYSEEERNKIEWAIGAVITGDSKEIQKFMVFYGAAGTGKSTILNVIQQLFDGYYSVFDAKALGSSNNSFALEAFKSNPLVAIQHDGDLSKIEDNTRLNSLVSHELMTVNEKFKTQYASRFRCFLFMGTNKPVKITDAKSGLIRRLIDVTPSGNKLKQKEYSDAVNQISFELGAIAYHCKEVYLDNPRRYDNYIPIAMMGASNDFYNFVCDSYSIFLKDDGTTLKAAWEMYKTYCEEAKVPFPLSQRNFREELRNYFREFIEKPDSGDLRNIYSGFRLEKFENDVDKPKKEEPKKNTSWLKFDTAESIFDAVCALCLAQYANDKGTPFRKWNEVTSILSNLDTSKLHYVRVPENHIVIDFDIKDKDGNKSYERNAEAASKWPPTYAELSKSGAGIHLHYIYSGDVSKLSAIYDEDIEVKVFSGNSSLRRKLSKCNDIPIATISSGLPFKEEKSVLNKEAVQTEKGLRTTIKKCLAKEVHAGTKSNIDFIFKILEDAYKSDLKFDVSDMKNAIVAFAANSTNQSDYCIKLVNQMHFKSDEPSIDIPDESKELVFFDCEVFPNLFLVNWKRAGEGNPVVRMINPKPADIEQLVKYNLIGFNCRRYDNHMIYACMLGYTNEQLYKLSGSIINAQKGDRNAGLFGEAYNISYTDVYDFAAKKQSLKKWEIELGIHHQELGLPWDQPVPEELWPKVGEYCDYDVLATEAVFNHLQGDFTARKILANLADGTVNDTTNSLTTKIIFGKDKNPPLVYTDLATGDSTDGTHADNNAFPGYEFIDGKNMYRETDLGYGGYVYAEPGMYGNVALLDVASLHPHSVLAMNCFGKYTKNFEDILDARISIKHKDFDTAKKMLNGKLAPYLDDPAQAKDLSKALKIAINSVYGLTSASFDNPFRDNRNKNNIVALRGALFMRTLQDEVTARGFKVAHIKTDSIKIPDATPEIIQFCMEFGKQYGYTFEHEATYERMCLVNNAVYIAKFATADQAKELYGYAPEECEEEGGKWTATGTQFAVPYLFKTMFSKEPIEFTDMCETFSVAKGDLYLDMNETLPDVTALEKERDKLFKSGAPCPDDILKKIDDGHDLKFVGRVGQFCPIKSGHGGGILYRVNEGKNYAAAGTTGYRWLESEMVKSSNKENDIDRTFYNTMIDTAITDISKYGDYEWFVSDEPYVPVSPWDAPCPPWWNDDAFNKR